MDSGILRENLIFWSRLGMGDDTAETADDAHPVIYDEKFTELKFHRDFYKRGIKIHSFILSSGWIGDGTYDYTTAFKVMDAAVKIDPDVMLLPRINLNVPVDWCLSHPEEVFVYYDGPRTADEIKKLVGTAEHDYLGYESSDGRYMGCPKYARPNMNGKISLQSFSSRVWLEDAKTVLQSLINKLERRYKGRIIGYHIAYGTTGETMLWGRSPEKYGDYGITNQKLFKEYLKEKYGIEASLLSPEERYGKKERLKDFLRIDNDISVYYDEFTSEVNSYAAEYLCKAVKEISPESLTGVFYGYFMGVYNIAYTGHTAMDKLLDSPYIDFLAAPKLDYRSNSGDSCGEFGVSQSVNRKKLWIDVCDINTHLAEGVYVKRPCMDFTQTKNSLVREFTKNVSQNSGMIITDAGGGWYDSEELLDLAEKLNDLNLKLRTKAYKSISDVLVLADEASVMRTSFSRNYFEGYITDFLCNLKKTGVIADVYRYSDLKILDLSRYKLIIFPHNLYLSEEDIDYISRRTNAAFMFNYAAGMIKDNKISLENSKNVTGFYVYENIETKYDFPQLTVYDYDNIIYEEEGGKTVSKKINNRLRILNTVPYLNIEAIRKAAVKSNCHIYCWGNCVVYGDNRFLSVIADKDGYNGLIDFGAVKEWYNVITDEAGSNSKLELNLEPFGTALFIFDDIYGKDLL